MVQLQLLLHSTIGRWRSKPYDSNGSKEGAKAMADGENKFMYSNVASVKHNNSCNIGRGG